jgi:hypothetical protein
MSVACSFCDVDAVTDDTAPKAALDELRALGVDVITV